MENYDLRKKVDVVELELYNKIIENHEDVVKIIDMLPVWILILNRTRQAVYYNKKIYDDLGFTSPQDIIGKRPGDIFNCMYSTLDVDGCGSSKFCKYCGALHAIVKSFNGHEQKEACHLLRNINGKKEAIDLEVTATPLTVEDLDLTLFVIQDISDANRRLYLERTFLHDIGNTVGAIISSTELIKDEDDPEAITELLELLVPSAYQLLDEIQAQSQIHKAESHQWEPTVTTMSSFNIIEECMAMCRNYIIDENITLSIRKECLDFDIHTETTLLKRIIINMIKNAIEASDGNEEILVCGNELDELSSMFSVKNAKFMPPDIKNQLFMRSFSTKGKGRGVGTYSMKLIAENYLDGQITVQSNEENGTIFSVIIPTKLREPNK